LLGLSRERGRFDVGFVTTDSEADFRAYVTAHGMTSATVWRRPAFERIRGTPTLVVIDKARGVLGIWAGRLSPEQEATVIELASSRSAS
jgi:hypothetical protein